jgi:membrane protein DedA with SNARE-associated domain
MAQQIHSIHKPLSRRWEYAVGILAIALVVALAVLVVINWRDPEQVKGYGYFGGFVLSILGGATVPIPLPVTAVYFGLGGVLKPWFGPDVLAPLLLGLVCGFGEALGGLSVYATGYSGAASLAHRPVGEKPGRAQRIYLRVMNLIQRHGGRMLFAVSAIINPFFYPISLAAGVTRFGLRRFFLICLAGKTVKCTYVAYAGYLGFRVLFDALGISV